jgi:TolB-like protein
MRVSVPALAGVLSVVASGFSSAVPQARAQKVTVAVIDFTNSALRDAANYEVFSNGIGQMLTTALAGSDSVTLVERVKLQNLLAEIGMVAGGQVDPQTAARAGKMLGAQYVLTGVFFVDFKNRLRLDARAVNTETSAIAYTESVSGDVDGIMEAVDQLAQKIMKRMKLPPIHEQRQAAAVPIDKRAGAYFATAVFWEDRGRIDKDPTGLQKAKEYYQQFLRATPPGYFPDQRKHAEERLKALSASG